METLVERAKETAQVAQERVQEAMMSDSNKVPVEVQKAVDTAIEQARKETHEEQAIEEPEEQDDQDELEDQEGGDKNLNLLKKKAETRHSKMIETNIENVVVPSQKAVMNSMRSYKAFIVDGTTRNPLVSYKGQEKRYFHGAPVAAGP